MKNYEVVYLAKALKMVDAPNMEPDFNYAISATASSAAAIAEDIMKAVAPSEEYQKYEEKLNEVREKHAEKDEEGNPMFMNLDNGNKQYLIADVNDPKNPFVKEFQKIVAANKELTDKREEQLKFLQKDNKNFSPEEVLKADIPKGLTREAMDAVYMIMNHE